MWSPLWPLREALFSGLASRSGTTDRDGPRGPGDYGVGSDVDEGPGRPEGGTMMWMVGQGDPHRRDSDVDKGGRETPPPPALEEE